MQEKNEFVLVDIEPSEICKAFIHNSRGIFLSSEDTFREGQRIMKPDTYQLAKWLKQNRPGLDIEIDTCKNIIELRSSEIWIPLIFLAQDIALPLFLSYIYDYLKNVTRGNLAKESSIVHLKVVCKGKTKYKELSYDGPVEGLSKIKNFDLNEFANE